MMVAQGLHYAESHGNVIETLILKIRKETLEDCVDSVGVGVLSFYFGQETEKIFTISVEEDDLDPEFLSYILPRPVLALKAIERWMEKKGWGRRRGEY